MLISFTSMFQLLALLPPVLPKVALISMSICMTGIKHQRLLDASHAPVSLVVSTGYLCDFIHDIRRDTAHLETHTPFSFFRNHCTE